MSGIDVLIAARRRFPMGDRVRGLISAKPWGDGQTGVMVNLGAEPGGFVDLIHLPDDARQSEVGREALFEVLQHRPGQVRLYPLDAGMRSHRRGPFRMAGPAWADLCVRHPVGSTATATVTDVFTSNREYVV